MSADPSDYSKYLVPTRVPSSPASKQDYAQIAREEAAKLKLPEKVVLNLFGLESGYNPKARSYKGAKGIGQMMPDTDRYIRNKYGIDTSTPRGQIQGSLHYLKEQYDEFKNDELAVAAYHAGPGAIRKAGGRIPNTSDGLTRTPDYVKKIVGTNELALKPSRVPSRPSSSGYEKYLVHENKAPNGTGYEKYLVDASSDAVTPSVTATPSENVLPFTPSRTPSTPTQVQAESSAAGVIPHSKATVPIGTTADPAMSATAKRTAESSPLSNPVAPAKPLTLDELKNRKKQLKLDAAIANMPDSGVLAQNRYQKNLTDLNADVEAYNRSLGNNRKAEMQPERVPSGYTPGVPLANNQPIDEQVKVFADDSDISEDDIYRGWYDAIKSGNFAAASMGARIYADRFPRGKYARNVYDPVSGAETVPQSEKKDAREGAVAVSLAGLDDLHGDELRQEIERRFKGGLGFDDASYENFVQQTGFEPARLAGYGTGRGQIKQSPEEFEASIRQMAGADNTALIRVPKTAAEKIQQFFNDKNLSDPSRALANATMSTVNGRLNLSDALQDLPLPIEAQAALTGLDALPDEVKGQLQQGAAGTAQGMLGTAASLAKGAGVLIREGAQLIGGDKTNTPISNMLIGLGNRANNFLKRASFENTSGEGLNAFTLGQGFGSAATFAASGGASKTASAILGAFSEAGSAYDETYERLINQGYSPEKAHKAAVNAAILNIPAGLSEGLLGAGATFERALEEGIAGAGWYRNFIGALAKAGTEEGLQERTQTRMENMVAQVAGDRRRPLSQGEAQGALIGLITGGVMQGGTNLAVHSAESDASLGHDITELNINQRESFLPNEEEESPSRFQQGVAKLTERGLQKLSELKSPTVAEKPQTIAEQLNALEQGKRQAVLITKGEILPDIPSGYFTTRTKEGTFIHKRDVKSKDVRKMVQDGTFGELLGHVAPKPVNGAPSATVAARDHQGNELQTSVVPPELAEQQAQLLQAQFPDASIEVGGDETAQNIIDERLSKSAGESIPAKETTTAPSNSAAQPAQAKDSGQTEKSNSFSLPTDGETQSSSLYKEEPAPKPGDRYQVDPAGGMSAVIDTTTGNRVNFPDSSFNAFSRNEARSRANALNQDAHTSAGASTSNANFSDYKKGDTVTHPNLAGGKPLEIVGVSNNGRNLDIKRKDGKGRVMQLQVDSPQGKGLQLVKSQETAIDAAAHEATTSTKDNEDTSHKFSTTQANLKGKVAATIKQIGQEIPDSSLAEDGRETQPHITVKYGLHGDDVEEVRPIIESTAPIKVIMGKTSVFQADKKDGADVVKVDVNGEDLHALSAKIAESLPNTETYPDYQPHATVAYVKPGEGKKFAGDDRLEGKEVTINSIAFSDKQGNIIEIPLKGKENGRTGNYKKGDVVTHPNLASGKEFEVVGVSNNGRNLDLKRKDGLGRVMQLALDTPQAEGLQRVLSSNAKGASDGQAGNQNSVNDSDGSGNTGADPGDIQSQPGRNDGADSAISKSGSDESPLAAAEPEKAIEENTPPEGNPVRASRQLAHEQFGTVTVSDNQSGVPDGKLRVTDQAGDAHIIQNPRKGGNQSATFIKPAETQQPAKPQSAITKLQEFGKAKSTAINAVVAKNSQPITDAKSLRQALEKASPQIGKKQFDILEKVINALAKGYVKMNPTKTEADFYKLIAGVQSGAKIGDGQTAVNGVPSSYELRPGESTNLYQLADAALRDTGRVGDSATSEKNNPQGESNPQQNYSEGTRRRLVGITIPLKRDSRIDLRGQTVRSARDVAQLAQVYRDPRYETFRIIYTKGNQIVAHEGITSRLPAANTAFVFDKWSKKTIIGVENQQKEILERLKNQSATQADVEMFQVLNKKLDLLDRAAKTRQIIEMRRRMHRLGADGYYLLHNHPSGNSYPSGDDLMVTAILMANVRGYKGHVIVDSNEYSLITKVVDTKNQKLSFRATTRKVDFGEEQHLVPSVPSPLQNVYLDEGDSDRVASIGKWLQVPEKWVAILYRSSKGKLRAIEEIPVNLFKRAKEVTDFLRGRQRMFGAVDAVAYTEDSSLYEHGKALVESGVLNDMVTSSTGARKQGVERGENPMDPESVTFGNRVSEPRTLAQDAKGATQFIEDGRAIIHLFEKADISTILHEMAHIARRYLDTKSSAVIEKWSGVKNGFWTRNAEEKFARAFEKYMRQGNAPTEELKSAFAKIKGWMREIYETLKGSAIDVNFNKDVENVFARMLGADVKIEAPQARAVTTPNTDDSLAEMVWKLGGLKKTQNDKGEMKWLRESPAGKRPGFFSESGYKLDQMRELVNQYGFQYETVNDFLDALQEEARGNRQYSVQKDFTQQIEDDWESFMGGVDEEVQPVATNFNEAMNDVDFRDAYAKIALQETSTDEDLEQFVTLAKYGYGFPEDLIDAILAEAEENRVGFRTEQADDPVTAEISTETPQQEILTEERSDGERQSDVEPAKALRYEAGKSLTPEQKKEVLKTIGDSYKKLGAPKVSKGQNRFGDEVLGYEYNPDYLLSSDITNRKIRHYIELPDERIAHPSELYPNLTQSEIDRHIADQQAEQEKIDRNERYDREAKIKRVAGVDVPENERKNRANANYTRTGRKLADSYFAKNEKGEIVRVDGADQKDVLFYERLGFQPITSTSSEPARTPSEENYRKNYGHDLSIVTETQKAGLTTDEFSRVHAIYETLKQQNTTVDDYLRQQGLFGSELNEKQQQLLRDLDTKSTRNKATAKQEGLFGEMQPTLESKKAQEENQPQATVSGDLFTRGKDKQNSTSDESIEEESKNEPQQTVKLVLPEITSAPGMSLSETEHSRRKELVDLLKERGITVAGDYVTGSAAQLKKAESAMKALNPDLKLSSIDDPYEQAFVDTLGKKTWEMTADQYIKRKHFQEIRKYERGVEQAKTELAATSDKRAKRIEELNRQIKYWSQVVEDRVGHLERNRAGYQKEYIATVAKAISQGEKVSDEIISQDAKLRTAKTARERYDKGRHTSFANKSSAVNDSMQQDRGYKVKRQDGKEITDKQIAEIAQGMDEIEKVLGPLADILRQGDVTIAHTSGKHPFLSTAGGLYSQNEKTITIGISGINGPIPSLAHEFGHWLDYEAGEGFKVESVIYTKSGNRVLTPASSERSEHNADGLISEARRTMRDTYEIRKMLRANAAKNATEEKKAEIELVKFKLTPYWNEPREIWARMVEQYVATKLTDRQEMPEHPVSVESDYTKMVGHWSAEDFAKMIPRIESQIAKRLAVVRNSLSPDAASLQKRQDAIDVLFQADDANANSFADLPEDIRDALKELADFHSVNTSTNFNEWSAAMKEDAGQWVKPYLREVFNSQSVAAIDKTIVNPDDHWNFKRSDLSPETEEAFRAAIQKAVAQTGDAHKRRVTQEEYRQRAAEIDPALVNELVNYKAGDPPPSREVFLAGSELAQSLNRQAMGLRGMMMSSTLPADELYRLQELAERMEEDAVSLIGGLIGVRSEYGRNLALLATMKSENRNVEQYLNRAKKLARRNAIDTNSAEWQEQERKIQGLTNEIKAAEAREKDLQAKIQKLQKSGGKSKGQKAKGKTSVNDIMLARLSALEKTAMQQLGVDSSNLLMQDGPTQILYQGSEDSNSLAAIYAAKIARNDSSLEKIDEAMSKAFGKRFDDNKLLVKKESDTLLRQVKQEAIREALGDQDKEVRLSARQELAKELQAARRADREAQTALKDEAAINAAAEKKQQQIEDAWARDEESAENELAEIEEKRQADEKSSDQAATARELALQARAQRVQDRLEAIRKRREQNQQLKDRNKSAKILERAERKSRAQEEREKLKTWNLLAADAQERENKAIREERRAQKRWDYSLQLDAKAARARLTDGNHLYSKNGQADMARVMAGLGGIEDQQAQTVIKEMTSLYGDAFVDNAPDIRDQAAKLVSDAKEKFRIKHQAAKATEGAAEYLTEDQITPLLAEYNRVQERKRESQHELARLFADLEKPSFTDRAWDTLAMTKSIVFSVDASFGLRQGMGLISEPRAFIKGWYKGIQTLLEKPFSRHAGTGYAHLVNEIQTDKMYPLARRAGLYFNFDGFVRGADPTLRSDYFQSTIAERVPGVARSERSFAANGDVLRYLVFTKYAEELQEAGFSPDTHFQHYKKLAEAINLLTMRGELGKFKALMKPMNALMGSPRALASKYQIAKMLVDPKTPMPVRKFLARKVAWQMAAFGAILYAAQLAGAEVDWWPPDEADWMKVRLGNTRYDLSVGWLPVIRMLYKMGAKRTLWEPLGDLAQNKVSPMAGTLWNLFRGEDNVGKPYGVSDALLAQMPLSMNEARESIGREGFKGFVKTVPLSFFGVGVQNYGSVGEGGAEYDRIKKLVNRWKDEQGMAMMNAGGEKTPKSEAASNYKRALLNADKKAADKYLREYVSLGADSKDLKRLFEGMHPLASLAAKYQGAFIASLSEQERKKLTQAIRFYYKTLSPNSPVETQQQEPAPASNAAPAVKQQSSNLQPPRPDLPGNSGYIRRVPSQM